jgi:NAD(P)-dependent dehydrogenase (short-subunit alcohol dehydrogenase family)
MSEALLSYQPQENYLQGRVIIVTGAGAGLGAVIAKAYAHFGATVILLSKTIAKLEKIYDEIIAAGDPEPLIYPVDLEGANITDYEKMAQGIEAQLGRLDGIVINAANLPTFTPFKHYDPELWGKVTMSNMQANFLLLRSCLPLLEQAADPAIIFSDHQSNKAYFGAFGVAKAGLAAMCDILADEYDTPKNFIRVNRIDTGPLRTQMRTLNFPGENPKTVAKPEAALGAYLFFMGADAENRTGEHIRFERLAADAKSPISLLSEQVAK